LAKNISEMYGIILLSGSVYTPSPAPTYFSQDFVDKHDFILFVLEVYLEDIFHSGIEAGDVRSSC